jgi:hypothetical protein
MLLSEETADWREEALKFGRAKHCDFVLLVGTDSLLLRDTLRHLISLEKVVVTPLLHSPFGTYSNAQELKLQEEFTQREKLSFVRVFY